ncbi:MAG: filamentous hemagglutinin N-terminal domain-containing protein [Scytonema sp. RU_4_4]|nr:filamentous hemagglutinin N-terminal domain-containing protein [Scytonema sp. RU_4_4]
MKHDWRSRPAQLPLGASCSGCFAASSLLGLLPAGVSRSVRKAHSLILFTLPLYIIGNLTSINTVTAQQVTSDGTVSTTVTSPDGKNFNINDGTTRGTNLFHSFKEFSVPTGGSANFNNATNIQNIINRVTGGSISNIDGLIKANGAANLFLLNPAGIVFGPNASLNIGGSFLGSTANSFIFDNGFEFSATDLQAPPLLTINIPIGLRYRDNPGSITTQSAFLQVPQGNFLALVGGNVSLDGAILYAPGGRIELGGLSATGTVGLNGDGSLSFPVGVQRGDVALTNGAIAYVAGTGGGNIGINARNLDLSGESVLYAGIESDSGAVGSQAGDITLNATGNIKIVESSYVYTNVNSQAVGNGGNINITTDSLSLTDGAQLITNTSGQGDAGNVSVQASGSVGLVNGYIYSTVDSQGVGSGGNINITTGSLFLNDGAQLITSTSGQGSAGSVTINARDTVSLDGQNQNGFSSGVFSFVSVEGLGNAGDITLITNSLSLTNEALISSGTYGLGNAGNINIFANRAATFANKSAVYSIVESTALGKGGNINIAVRELLLRDGAQLFAGTFGKGDAGNININAIDGTFIGGLDQSNNFAISTTVGSEAVGNAGNIRINAGSLSLRDNAQISASVLGIGNAGNITINAADTISLDGANSVISSTVGTSLAPKISVDIDPELGRPKVNLDSGSETVFENAQGRSGDIAINTRSLSLTNGARLSTSTSGQGDAGDININTYELTLNNGAQFVASSFGRGNAGSVMINARDTVSVDGQQTSTGIFSAVDEKGVGNAGDIQINTGSLSLKNGGRLTASNQGKGAAGNITVRTAKDIKLDNNASIDAFTIGGKGNITLSFRDLILRKKSNITTVTEGTDDAGSINASGGRGFTILLEESSIDTSAQAGFKEIFITGVGIFASQDSNIGGIYGFTTQLDIPTIELETVIDPAQQIAQNPCLRGGGEFTIIGRGGFPSNPNKILSSDNVRVDLVKPIASKVNSTSTTQKQPSTSATDKPIVPARGWIFNEKGEVMLVAYDPTKTGVQRSSPTPASCAAVK